MDNNITVELYPYRDKNNYLQINLIIKHNQSKIFKKFSVSKKNNSDIPNCKLPNKKGDLFDIPMQTIEEIYNFTQKIKDKLVSGESVESILKPNPSVKYFAEKYYIPLIESKQNNIWLVKKMLDYWKEYKIKNVTGFNIEQYKIELLKIIAPSTARRYMQHLNRIFDIAIAEGYREKSPFINVKLPPNMIVKERNPIPLNLLYDIFKKLEKKNINTYYYCRLLYYTGLRPVDAISLNYKENIEFEKGIKCIMIRESKTKQFNRGKTIIPIHPDLMEFIESQKNQDYILPYEFSRDNMIDRMSRNWRKLLSEYPQFSPYHFRHTFASALHSADIDITVINFLLGKLPAGTTKNYVKRNINLLYESICALPDINKIHEYKSAKVLNYSK